MGEITLNDLANAAKLITTVLAAITAIGTIVVYCMKQYMRPIIDRLDSIDNKLKDQNLELTDVKKDIEQIKNDVSCLNNKELNLENKMSNNRNLDALLVKTLRIMLDDSDNEQRKLKSELDSYLIDEAVTRG